MYTISRFFGRQGGKIKIINENILFSSINLNLHATLFQVITKFLISLKQSTEPPPKRQYQLLTDK